MTAGSPSVDINSVSNHFGLSPMAAGPNLPVLGGGTLGRLTKWTGFTSSNSFIGDSTIFQSKLGLVGIGTDTPTSKLTVQGMIETTLGGLKFPDGTVQTTAAVSGLQTVFHDATLTGNGTAGSPLGVAVPLILRGSVELGGGVIQATNTAEFGGGVMANGGPGGTGVFGRGGVSTSGDVGVGVEARGGNSDSSFGGAGAVAVGGLSDSGTGGEGAVAAGGQSTSGRGGDGVRSRGGNSDSSFGGAGVVARGGQSSSGFGGEGVVAEGGFSLSGGGNGVLATGGMGTGPGNSAGIGINAFGGLGQAGATDGLAGKFNGDVEVTGNLSRGGGSFKIDHPVDPEKKYLYHSFVESPDMKNIYDGNVVTDENGEARVTLPNYFEALNRDFRYQLTVIGMFAQAIVADEVKGNRFVIRTSAPNVKVSWQVTGIRQDAFANKNRIKVEVEKSERERGYYLHPGAFNQPQERGIGWARNPELKQQLKTQRIESKQKPNNI